MMGYFFKKVFIACLTKAIGKTTLLKASSIDLKTLPARNDVTFLTVAATCAFPIARGALYSSMEDFAYRINIPFLFFIVAGNIAAFIAMLTSNVQAAGKTLSNPVKPLITE